MNTPVLLLVFNRPNVTSKVFERIREVKPRYLYVAADGPRLSHPEDNQKCEDVRKIATAVDWDCELRTLFREDNLGCGLAVSQAITWFFNRVEEGIILEDDILPDVSFFDFCTCLLKQYKHDTRVMMISGLNICGEWKSNTQSYHFSYFGGIWGWATWRRAWDHYDVEMRLWNNNEIKDLLKKKYFTKAQFNRRYEEYKKIVNNELDTWDYQWGFAKLINSGLNIIPAVNLIENLGFGEEATHTQSTEHVWAQLPVKSLKLPIERNKSVIADVEYDQHHLEPLQFGKKQTTKEYKRWIKKKFFCEK